MGDNRNETTPFAEKNYSESGVNLVKTVHSDAININNASGAGVFGRRISITAGLLGRARDWITGISPANNGEKADTFEVGSYTPKRSTSIIPTDELEHIEVSARRSRSRSLCSESDLVAERRDIIIPGPVF